MNAEELKLVQAPLKQQYKDEPDAATITLRARGQVGEGITWPGARMWLKHGLYRTADGVWFYTAKRRIPEP